MQAEMTTAATATPRLTITDSVLVGNLARQGLGGAIGNLSLGGSADVSIGGDRDRLDHHDQALYAQPQPGVVRRRHLQWRDGQPRQRLHRTRVHSGRKSGDHRWRRGLQRRRRNIPQPRGRHHAQPPRQHRQRPNFLLGTPAHTSTAELNSGAARTGRLLRSQP